MGIATVAVFSDADANALHVRMADESVNIGPGEASESYLRADKILAAARSTGADAIHPGYGFLSERAEFSEACNAAGITFIGPGPDAMRKLGSKSDAKTLAEAQSVPIVPGMFRPGASMDELRVAADAIGYPIMLKASAGGGGRGMRVVRDPAQFESEFEIASSEALKGFGDGAMMVEKLVDRPRHVELQMLADAHGSVAAIFERECSLQRRHQKILEEAPSPVDRYGVRFWPRMREAACRLLRAAGYVGAGTVEFIVDDVAEEFYFLEVNARLQVEHPVTEAITGLDLVEWQVRIARGESLDLPPAITDGERAAIQGHSIEARIVAEDPAKNFLPSVGTILAWHEPKTGVRVDTGYGPDAEILRFYDSLIAKLIVHGASRLEAIAKLRDALLDFHVLGVRTNIAYLLDVIDHPDFAAGRFDTGFLGREFSDWTPGPVPDALVDILSYMNPPETSATAWGAGDRFRNARG